MSEARGDQPILRLEKLVKTFGGLTAVKELTLEVRPLSVSSLIGPNGAGKTTVFNMITGLYPVTSGQILLEGRDVAGLLPHQVTLRGISRTFQNIRLFANMTVLENVLVGQHGLMKASYWGSILRTGFERAEERRVQEEAQALLSYVGLEERLNDLARGLPYGLQRRLEIARALASRPRLLLLDEPAAGANPQEKLELGELISRIPAERGATVLLIEHDMRVVMGISDQVTVLDYGEKIAEGTPEEVRQMPRVIEAYLGKGAAEESAAGPRSGGAE